jgi:hypothetical protein
VATGAVPLLTGVQSRCSGSAIVVAVVGVIAVVVGPGPVVSTGVSPTIVLQAVRARVHRVERMT